MTSVTKKDFKMRWGIRIKIAGTILIVGILTVTVGISLLYIDATNSLKTSIGKGFQELSIRTASKIDTIIKHEVFETQNMAISPLINSYVQSVNRNYRAKDAPDKEDVERYLMEIMNLSPEEYLNIFITDEKGMVIAAAKRRNDDYYHLGGWWESVYKEGQGGAYVSGINLDSETSIHYIRFSSPIMDRIKDKFVGTITIDSTIGYIFKPILEMKIGETGHANLIDSDGNLIIDPLVPIMGLKLTKELLNAVVKDESGWIIHDDEHGGRDAILGFAPVTSSFEYDKSFRGKRWFVFIGLDPKETYLPIYAFLKRASLVGFGMVVMLTLLGYIVSKRLVKPIYALHKWAELVGMGNLDHKLDIHTNDEIEDLAMSFNQMAERLKALIEEEKKMERELAKQRRLAAIGQFSTGIAHEIRNPLSSIKMSLDILLKRLKPTGNDKVRLEIAKMEVERLEMLVKDILLFAKPSKPSLSAGDINEVLESSFKVVEDLLNDRGISVIKDYCRNIPMIPLDHERLKQAFLNIFLNSLQAMDSRYVHEEPAPYLIRGSNQGNRGLLSIKTTKFSHSDNKGINIEVSDNGCGIKKEDMEKIFDPFFTTRGDGTGLGLTNVKTIISQHSGVIEIKSEEGMGTTVTICLPEEGQNNYFGNT